MKRLIAAALISSALLAGRADAASARNPSDYQNIFVIVLENRAVSDILGNPVAPNLTRMAKQYGLATHFFTETHPSQPNYIALVGGSTFGIADDGEHPLSGRTLMDQLTEKGLTWKGYFESLPAPGFKGAYSMGSAGEPPQLYAAKHNGFISFASVRSDPALAAKIVGFDRLKADLASGNAPNYAHIVPNQCDDMHGLGGDKVSHACDYKNDAGLIAQGDAKTAEIVRLIQASPIWGKPGKVAIVITWDEDDGPHHDSDPAKQGCCGFKPGEKGNEGGGRIPTIVITNHGPHPLTDEVPYNHYSVLRTVEEAFGIAEHLRNAGNDAKGVRPMKKLFGLL